MLPFGYVNEDKPHTVITVNHPVLLMPLRRARLAPGVYKIQGNVLGMLGNVRERRMMASGLFSVEFKNGTGKKVSAPTQTRPLNNFPQESVTTKNEAAYEDTAATAKAAYTPPPAIETETTSPDPAGSEKNEQSMKTIRGNTKLRKLADLLLDGHRVIYDGIEFRRVQMPENPGEPCTDFVEFTQDSVVYIKLIKELREMDMTVSSFINPPLPTVSPEVAEVFTSAAEQPVAEPVATEVVETAVHDEEVVPDDLLDYVLHDDCKQPTTEEAAVDDFTPRDRTRF